MPTEAYAHGGLCPRPARAPHVTEKGYMSFRDRLSFAIFLYFASLICFVVLSSQKQREEIFRAMAQDVAHEQHVKWLKEQIDQQKSELAEVQAKAVQLKASIVYYEGMLALVAPKEVASTPTEMLSETEALTLNGGQVASTSSLGADEHLKGGLANFSLASEDASLEKATSQNRILKRGGQLFFVFTQ